MPCSPTRTWQIGRFPQKIQAVGFFALIAQLVEQLPLKQTVPGSSPGGGTKQKQPEECLTLLGLFKTLFSSKTSHGPL